MDISSTQFFGGEHQHTHNLAGVFLFDDWFYLDIFKANLKLCFGINAIYIYIYMIILFMAGIREDN